MGGNDSFRRLFVQTRPRVGSAQPSGNGKDQRNGPPVGDKPPQVHMGVTVKSMPSLSSRRNRKRLFTFLAIFIIAIAAIIGWFVYELHSPHSRPNTEATVIIPRGSGTGTIIDKLHEADIISSRIPMLVWVKLGSGKRLKAGEYRFPSPITPMEAIERMERGEIVQYHVTIPEGYNRFDVANTLAKTGKADVATFESLTADPSSISDIDPQARDLEGYLFPDTYTYTYETIPQDFIKLMTDRFKSVFTETWRQRAGEIGSIHDVVTMGSIIEKEAKNPDERTVIASVFYNRIKKNMLLETDPTFIYAAILAGDYNGNVNDPRHRRRNSPYNTYLHPGLPPGPISSPGRKSLEAALYPADTNFYYFVATGVDGSHHFSRSIDEHNRAVADYRKQLQQQRQQPPISGGR